MLTVTEIRQFKEYLEKDYHRARLAQQKRMQEYYDDVFPVPQIRSVKNIYRTATGPDLVDGPASHIITRNPQVFVEPKRQTDAHRESAVKVNALNNHWVRHIVKQSPQPLKEFVKNMLLRGEAWIHLWPVEEWNQENDKVLPITFRVMDPLNVLGSPIESLGIPSAVVIMYETSPYLVKRLYADWTDPKRKGWQPGDMSHKTVSWWEYWDADQRYFEADDEAVTDGTEQNIIGCVSFVHAYSGFGKESPEGKPETLTVGRLDKVTDLLLQECVMNSDIHRTFTKFARPRVDATVDAMVDVNVADFKKNYDMAEESLNVYPKGIDVKEGLRILPTSEAFQHFANLQVKIARLAPPIMSGLPSGTSGRQEDIMGYHFIRRFDSVVEATEDAWGKALDIARDITVKMPSWLPVTQWLEQPDGGKKEITIDRDDFLNVTDAQVKLKAADPVQDDRRLQAGRLLRDGPTPHISEEEFLVSYVGYTSEKAQEEIVKTIAGRVVNESLLPFIARKALEKLGMDEELKQLDTDQQLQVRMAQALQERTSGMNGPRGGEPRIGNVQTEAGREMPDVNMAQRGVRAPAGMMQ